MWTSQLPDKRSEQAGRLADGKCVRRYSLWATEVVGLGSPFMVLRSTRLVWGWRIWSEMIKRMWTKKLVHVALDVRFGWLID